MSLFNKGDQLFNCTTSFKW